MATVTSQVFFDIAVDDAPFGMIIVALYGNDVPKTAENFRALCTGERGGRLTYKGSAFFSVVTGFCLRGGDITNDDGTGGESIYGVRFYDESFGLKHVEPGVLSMYSAARDSNGSQFLITTVATPWLDGKQVVFGKVVTGMDVVKNIEALGSSNGRASKKIVINNCGELKVFQ